MVFIRALRAACLLLFYTISETQWCFFPPSEETNHKNPPLGGREFQSFLNVAVPLLAHRLSKSLCASASLSASLYYDQFFPNFRDHRGLLTAGPDSPHWDPGDAEQLPCTPHTSCRVSMPASQRPWPPVQALLSSVSPSAPVHRSSRSCSGAPRSKTVRSTCLPLHPRFPLLPVFFPALRKCYAHPTFSSISSSPWRLTLNFCSFVSFVCP